MDLQIRGVSKTYANGVQALKHVTLTIPQGMYGLLGPNGAGKSTLMRIVATLRGYECAASCQSDRTAMPDRCDVVTRALGALPAGLEHRTYLRH